MNLLRSTAFIVVMAFALSSCLINSRQGSRSECLPPPVPQCKPMASSHPDEQGIRLSLVDGLDTPLHEWSLSSFDSKTQWGSSFLTMEPAFNQELRSVAWFDLGKAGTSQTSIPSSDVVASIGFLCGSRNGAVIVATQKKKGSVEADLLVLKGPAKGLEDINTEEHFEGHPALSSDGTLMVFTSNRPGGLGGTDLWYSVLHGGTWTAPQNLGPTVNTTCDDIGPALYQDTLLLFSSSGHTTKGGYDLFAAPLSLDKGTPTIGPMRYFGAPINTASDEVFPQMRSVENDETALYFASNRVSNPLKSSTNFDIYVAAPSPERILAAKSRRTSLDKKVPTDAAPRVPKPDQSAVASEQTAANTTKQNPKLVEVSAADSTAREALKPVTLRGKVTSKPGNSPVGGARVDARNPQTSAVYDSARSGRDGTFTLTVPEKTPMVIKAQSDKAFYESKSLVSPPAGTNAALDLDFQLPLVLTIRINFEYDSYDNPYPMLLDSNGLETITAWKDGLDELARNILSSGSKVTVKLIGHTDSIASDAYNLRLAQSRAAFVADQLVQRGVRKSILVVSSRGERDALPSRPGESDDIYRKRLRRVEVEKVFK